MTDPEPLAKGTKRRTIPSTCQTHRGPLDPHVARCCVITLDAEQATALRNTLTEWLS